ncbi:MAG: DUF3344 domain-containing protein [Methanosarcinaceae archaeon]|nr:DUF3344 domain-containing protein [Methanosarcinaceae archaeon]
MKPIKIALLLLMACIFASPASAVYNYNGYDLITAAHDTINGEVYVGGGHGIADAVSQPYSQDFAVPSGTVNFARLYVGVWGSTETYVGTLQTTFNGNDLGTLTLEGELDSNANVWCTGHGVYWVYYDVTSLTASGTNTAVSSTAKISPSFDGRIYGMVLVAAVENPAKTEVEYWINDGHWNLNSLFNTATTLFSGTIANPDGKCAILSTVYLAGDPLDADTLQFNAGSVITDAADGRGSDEWGNSWQGAFDIDEWWNSAINGASILTAENNAATFDRGTDPYLHPVLAVLEVRPDMLGDVNVDGSVNIFDAVKTRNRAINPSYILECSWAADANQDDYINIFDAVKVRNRAINPEYPLP